MSTMRARFGLNAILLAIFSVLALIVVSESSKQEPPPRKLSAIAPQSVKSIGITRSPGVDIELRKEAGRWLLIQPYAVPADEPRIQALLDFLASEIGEAFPAKDHDLRRFGLAESGPALRFDDARFVFGDANPLSGRRYVLHGDRIYLVFETIYPTLTGPAEELASSRLLEVGAEPVKLTLPDYTLALGSQGAWSVVPADSQMDSAALKKLVDEWKHGRATTVRRREKKTSQGTIGIEFREGPSARFEILARKPEFLLARSGLDLEYAMPAETGRRLLAPEKVGKPAAASEKASASKR